MYYSRLICVFTSHSSFTFLALDIQRDGLVRYITSHVNGSARHRSIANSSRFIATRLFRLYPSLATEQIAETQDQYDSIDNVC